MLETVREYAGERLIASAESEDVLRRHAACFLQLAERAEPELMGRDQIAWLARLQTEHDNFRGALSYLRLDQSSELLLRLAGALFRFWFVRGHLHEGTKRLEQALAMSSLGDITGSQAKALGAAAQLAYRLGEYERAKMLNAEAMSACRRLDDHVGVGRTLNRLADVAEAEGNLDEAEALWAQSAEIARQAEDRFGFAVATGNLGSLMLTRGDYGRAVALTEESLALFRELGHLHGTAVALENLGSAAVREGRHADAVPLLKESLAFYQQLDAPVYLAGALSELAAVAAMRGDAVAAARLLGGVDAALTESGGTLTLDTQRVLQSAVASARARLAPPQFEREWSIGREGGLDTALEYALASID
jgi:tetratricopeptide (TPR) repeat protein